MGFSEAFWTFSPKVLEKYLALLQDNLEIPLRPIQATQMTSGPFWTRQKMLEAIGTSNRNFIEGIISPWFMFEGAPSCQLLPGPSVNSSQPCSSVCPVSAAVSTAAGM